MTAQRLIETSHIGRVANYFASPYTKPLLVILALISLAIPATAGAVTPISQGYSSSDKLSVGSIVSLQNNTTDQVSATTISNLNSIFGVVINDSNSLISLTSGQGEQFQVATSGVVQVLVSDISGDIYQGDQITASPISGVGMKATDSVKVVGIAQDRLSNNNGSKQSYKDKNGHKHTVLAGQVPVLINVSYYYKQPIKTLIPTAVQNIANAMAGRPVNSLPILISMGIFILTMIIVTIIVYSMVHGSLISVGRNPMSQSAIYRELIQMSALVVGILGVAVVSIYMVLSKF
jgi:hypothetical protein